MRWLRLLAATLLTLPRLSGGLGSAGVAGRNERAGLLVRSSTLQRTTLDAKGQARLGEDISTLRKDQDAPKDVVTSATQYLLHNFDGLTFDHKMPVGTVAGTHGCQGFTHCQFRTYDEASWFCNNNDECHGILQEADPLETGCVGGIGCFVPASGQLLFDQAWLDTKGKTFERQVLAYGHVQDGRTFSHTFPVGTRQCPGTHYCQFPRLHSALAFCDLDHDCLGVMKSPANDTHCPNGETCYTPGKGDVQHDPVWLNDLGETYLKQQEVAYVLRAGTGYLYDGRYPTGTSGCQGAHNCQFLTLAPAKAYCDANPTCKGVIEHTPEPNGNTACTGGQGCFEPVKGALKYDEMFHVMEGKLYQRLIVR